MQTSDSIKEIAAALVAFHKEVGKIKKDATNPHLKKKYASLSGILDAIDEPLQKNGLSILQFPEGENGLTTRLLHASGEWMESTYHMKPVKDDPQGRGSALSYQRRYAVSGILSLNIDDEDDDGHTSSYVSQSQAQNRAGVADDKPWLNKGTKEFNGAIKKLKEGTTTIQKIEAVYKLNKEVKEELRAAEAEPMPS